MRIKLIEYVIPKTPGVGLVVIDGIKDLVSDINSGPEATKIADMLLQLTSVHDIHVVVLLHQNKGDMNARGHLGTELVNKAETVVSVARESKNPEVSIVEAEYTRDKEFEPFAFEINDEGLPEVIEGWRKKSASKRNTGKISPSEMTVDQHKLMLEEICKNIGDSKPKYKETLKLIQDAYDKVTKITIGINYASDYLTYYLEKQLIRKNGSDRSPNAFYHVDPNNFQF